MAGFVSTSDWLGIAAIGLLLTFFMMYLQLRELRQDRREDYLRRVVPIVSVEVLEPAADGTTPLLVFADGAGAAYAIEVGLHADGGNSWQAGPPLRRLAAGSSARMALATVPRRPFVGRLEVTFTDFYGQRHPAWHTVTCASGRLDITDAPHWACEGCVVHPRSTPSVPVPGTPRSPLLPADVAAAVMPTLLMARQLGQRLARSMSTGEAVAWTPERTRITAGLMLALFVSALDTTIVGTALPTIGRQLGGFALYPWIFAAYLLTSTCTVPIWGRLADIYGRKPILLAGLLIFVSGSQLCSLSTSMLALVIFRALQGIGAGCLQPVTFTIVGDIFPLAQRARIQGLFSSVWAAAALIGPTLGAILVNTVGWRWIFYVNVPIGAVVVALIIQYREGAHTAIHKEIDWAGAATLVFGLGLLLWGLGSGTTGGQPSPGAIVAGLLLLAVFLLIETRGEGALLPVDLLQDPVIGPATLAATLGGAVMFATTSYAPLFVQGALGGSALAAGAAIAPLSLGWPLASFIGGRLILRYGYQRLVGAGGLLLLLGTFMLASADAQRGAPWVSLSAFVLGMGLGFVQTPILVVVQNAVPWSRRGVATALNTFSRTIGGSVAVSLLGLVIQTQLTHQLLAHNLRVGLANNPLQAATGASRLGTQGRQILEASIHPVFAVMVVLALCLLLVSVAIMVRGRPLLPSTIPPSPVPPTEILPQPD